MAPELAKRPSWFAASTPGRGGAGAAGGKGMDKNASDDSLPPALTLKTPGSLSASSLGGPTAGGLVLGEEMGGTLGMSPGLGISSSRGMAAAAVVDLDDELARKLRDAVHKEAISLSEPGSPAAVTEFLKTLCATYGVKPDKTISESKHYLMSREGFVKAAGEALKHLAPGDAGPIYDKLAKEAGASGVNYKTILTFISLDEADIRRLARTLRLKIQEKGANEKSYRKLFPKLASGKYLDRSKLHELLHENFRVSLNERDIQGLFKYMDVDNDGEVSQEDFLLFLKHTGEQFDERGAQRSTTIVDVAVSLSADQEAALAQLGYQMSEGNLNANSFGTSRIYLWYRRMSAVPAGQPVSPLVNIALHREKYCSALVAAGYVRISHNINRGLTSRTPLFIWAKRAMTEAEADRDAILDVAVTSGRPMVREDKIWLPPSKDFIRVDGNLNERFFGLGVFLWFRAHTRRPLEVQKASPIKLVEHLTTPEKRALVETNVKHYLRHYPPLWTLREQMCPRADFAALFNKYDRGGRGAITPDRFADLLREVGLCVEREQLLALVHRIDRSSDSLVSLDEYLAFLALSDDDMDQMEETIRQRFKLTKTELGYSNSRKFRIIKKRFHEYNAEANGILSRSDIFALCRSAGFLLSEPEVLNMQKRLDKDGNGQVDIWDFLRFLDAPDESKSRREKRVHEACERLRHAILDRQNERKKLQAAGHVDSETTWNNLKDRRRAVGAMPFTGVLMAEDFQQAVARMGMILSSAEGHQLCMRINPCARNEVDQPAFHAFACRTPRFVTEVVNLMESEFIKDLIDVYRYSGKKHREKLLTTVRLRGAAEAGGNKSAADADDLDSGNALYEEALDEMVAEYCPDERGQLTAPRLRKAMFTAVNVPESEGVLLDEEVVALAQYVGADDTRTYAINVRKFLEGVVVFAEALANGGPGAAKAAGSDYSLMVDAEDEEAVIDVCIDIQRFIREKARLLDGTHNYQKAFDLFDEDGSGSITLIELKHMLERFNILPRLEERTVLKLMERFDMSGEGLVSADEFKHFCETVFVQAPWENGGEDGGKDGSGEGGGGKEGGGEKKRLDLDVFIGKITSDKVADVLVIDLLKAMVRDGRALTRVNLQDLQKAFLGSDPDLAGVITRHEFFRALDKAKLTIGMDTYNASRALEFFMEDEDLVDYEAIIHALSRLRHLASTRLRAKRPVIEPAKDLAFTGHVKLDAKLGTMRADMQRLMDERGTSRPSGAAPRLDPYRVFWKLDDDHDGKLTLSEFKRGMDKLKFSKGVSLSEKETRTLFRRLDVDKTHKVDYREFIEFMLAGEDSKLMQTKREEAGRKAQDPFYFESSDEEGEDGEDDVEETTVPGSSGAAADTKREELYGRVFRALLEHEPVDGKRRAFIALLKKFDRTGQGVVSDRRFRAFVYKCQIDLHLSKSEVRWLIRDLDPDMTGDVDYARFFERLQKFEAAREKEQKEKEGKGGKGGGGDKDKKQASIDSVAPLLKRVFDGINMSAVKGRPYHSLFSLSDEMQTGTVTREAFEHTLTMMGCPLAKDEVQTVLDLLTPRKDKLVDYEELYHLILRTPGVGLLVGSGGGGGGFAGDTMAFMGPSGDMGRTGGVMRRTSVNPVRMPAGRTLRFGSNTSIPGHHQHQMMMSTAGPATVMLPGAAGTQFMRTGGLNFMQTQQDGFGGLLDASAAAGGPLSRSIKDDWGIDVIDPMLDNIGQRVRNCIRDRVQQWGPSFSLHRQFESNDPERKGYLPKKDFARVLQHLGAPLSVMELAQVVQKFDRYGDSMVDYEEFCRVIMVDPKEFDGIVRRVAARLADLRRKGTNVVTAFEMFDMDGSGFVAARDFREACKQLQLPSTEVQLQTLMEHFASIGDPNLICYDDFLTYVTGIKVPAAGMGMTGRQTMGFTSSLMGQPQHQQYGGLGGLGSIDDSYAGDFINNRAASTVLDGGPFPEVTTSRRLDFAMTQSHDLLGASRAADSLGTDPWRRTSGLTPNRRGMQATQQTNYGNSMLLTRPVLSSGASPYHSPARTHHAGGFAAELGATTAGRRRAVHWMCPVCFFAENESKSAVCEMCTSPNPARGDMQILQQCFNCSFQNGDYAAECEMCGEPLASRASRTVRRESPRKDRAAEPTEPRWRTYKAGGGSRGHGKGSDSDDSDCEAPKRSRRGGGR